MREAGRNQGADLPVEIFLLPGCNPASGKIQPFTLESGGADTLNYTGVIFFCGKDIAPVAPRRVALVSLACPQTFPRSFSVLVPRAPFLRA